MREYERAKLVGNKLVGRWFSVLFLCAMAGGGCDEIRLRERDGFTQTPVPQPSAMRMQVSWSGLESMYRSSSSQGFGVRREATKIQEATREIRVGPVEQYLSIEDWTVMPEVDSGSFLASVSMRVSRPKIFVPVRVQTTHSVQICRFEVGFEKLSIRANVGIETTPEGPVMSTGPSAQDAAQVNTTGINIRAIGGCTSLEGSGWYQSQPLNTLLQTYVEDAFSESAAAAFHSSPLDTLGLIRRRVELSRVSAFENRRGALLVSGNLATVQGLEFQEQGLAARLDVALGQKRAGCAPSSGLSVSTQEPAGAVNAGQMAQFQADVGLAIATTMLERLAQGATAAGFSCRGLEDPRPADENREVIPADTLRLQDVGLGSLEIGPWARIAIVPGALPELVTRVDKNDLLMSWNNLTLDLYAEVFGVLLRIVRVTADVEMGLIPRADVPGMIGFEIDTVAVNNVQIESAWISETLDEQKSMNWVRRLMFIALDGQLSLPLPLNPGTQLKVVGTQIRAKDLVLFLRF